MFYGIRDLEEATDYLHEPLLGQRLIEISTALLNLKTNDPYQVIGSPDDIKVKSCMTLFAGVREAPPIFQQVLDRFYNGEKDRRTLALIESQL